MFSFDQAIQITSDPDNRGHYHAHLLKEWCIGQVPHGGYLLAILLNAMKTHSDIHHGKLAQRDPIQMSVAFIVKAQIGVARVTVEELKIGRGYSNYRIALQQQEADGSWMTLIHGLGIMGSFAKEDGPSVTTTPRRPPKQTECAPMFPIYADFRHVANNFEYWEHEDHKGTAETEQHWLGFKDRRPMDDLAMGLISDLMTPLPLRVIPAERGWYPTLSLDLQFKQAPKADGLFTFLEVETESIKNGRFDITTRCFDADRELIAISRHTAMIVSAARNLAKRGSRAKM